MLRFIIKIGFIISVLLRFENNIGSVNIYSEDYLKETYCIVDAKTNKPVVIAGNEEYTFTPVSKFGENFYNGIFTEKPKEPSISYGEVSIC